MKYLKLAAVLFATTTLFGCVTSRGELNLDAPAVANGNGQKVVITALDERRFELKPKSADIPSLKDGEITDKSITERAFARKRNSYGMAMGDILLPQNATVSMVIAKSIASAYSKAGYQVVPSSEKTADTHTVTVHIVEFWSWMSPGAFSVAVNNKAHLKVDTEGAAAPIEIVTNKRESMQMVVGRDWKAITEQGLQEISSSMSAQLPPR